MNLKRIVVIVEREGLLGLYHAGLFDPQTCWPAPALMLYWDHVGLSPLLDCRRNEERNQEGVRA